MSPICRFTILLVVLFVMDPRVVHALPPIHTFGKISSSYRLNKPSKGTDTQSLANTWEVGAASYIWQPWFGLWRATGAISRADTSADQDSSAEILTGDVEVNLFHRSHFPFSAFVGVRDTRVEVGSLSEATSDLRTLRFGMTQQYQDLANGIFYLATLNRDEQQDVASSERSISNRAVLSADRRGEVHSLHGVLSTNQSSNTVANSEVTANQATVSHNYRPTKYLTINNNANVSSVESGSDLAVSASTVYGASSQAEWRPEDMRLRLRGDIAASHEETSASGQPAEFRDQLRSRASARYELSDEMNIFGEVGLDRQKTQSGDQVSTFQAISTTYTAQPIDWRGFSYAWTAGGGAGNQTDSEEGGAQSQTVNASHTLTRTWTPDIAGPMPIVLSAGQEGRFVNETEEGPQTQIVHRATLSSTKSTKNGTAYGQLSMFDIRTFGRIETELFSVNAAATYNKVLSRYRHLDSVASYNYNTSSTAGVDQQRDVLSVEVRFRDSRLFDVNRLDLESRLRFGASNLLARTDDELSYDLEWDNRLGYRIGLLEINGRFGVTQTTNNRNLLFMLTMTRRF